MKLDRPLPLLLFTGTAFGCNFPLGKLAREAGVNPALWAVLICLGTGIMTGLVAATVEKRPAVPGIFRYAVISGFVSNVIPLFLTFAAISHIGSGLASIMVATSPVMTALLSILLKVKPPSPLGLAGIGLGLAGAVIIIIARNAGLGGGDAHWLLLAVLIPVFLGVGNVYRSMAWPPGAAPMQLASAVNLAAVPPLLVLAWMWSGIDLMPLTQVPFPVFAQLVASTIMYLTFFRLQAVGGPTYLSQIGYVAAVIGVGAGVTLLGETYPLLVWAGVAVVVAGIILTTLAQARQQAAPQTLPKS